MQVRPSRDEGGMKLERISAPRVLSGARKEVAVRCCTRTQVAQGGAGVAACDDRDLGELQLHGLPHTTPPAAPVTASELKARVAVRALHAPALPVVQKPPLAELGGLGRG